MLFLSTGDARFFMKLMSVGGACGRILCGKSRVLMSDRYLNQVGELALRDWPLICVVIISASMLLWRVGSNVCTLLHIRKQGVQQRQYYAAKVWGARVSSLVILLLVDCLVVVMTGLVVTLRLIDVAIN